MLFRSQCPADCQTFTPYTRSFFQWRSGSTTGPIIATNPTNVVTVSPTTTTTYYASWQFGILPLCTDPITITVVPQTLTFSSQSNNTVCTTPYTGSIVFNTNFGAGTYTMSYSKNGTATTASVTVAGGVATLTGLDAGTYTNFSFPVPSGCAPASVAGPYTITNPPTPTGAGASICVGAASVAMTSGIPTSPAIAQGAVFNSGALTATDPRWDRNTGGTTCNATATALEYYDVFAFTVSTAGSYTFDGCFPAIDGHASLYQNAFNGANPCGTPGNFIIADDDSAPLCGSDPRFTATLATGVTYYIISTSFSSGATDTYSWTFTGPAGATITNPSASGTSQWYTTATGGTPISTASPFNPVGVAGSGITNTATATVVTYYLAYSTAPTCRTAITYTISGVSTAPTIGGVPAINCPNTDLALTYSGGVVGAGSSVRWYTGAGGTGTLLGTNAGITVAPLVTTTYYIRREGGTCANSGDNSVTVTVRPFAYTTTASTSTTTYCTDRDGWKHFYTSANEIIFSVKGNLGTGTPTASIALRPTAAPNYYKSANGVINCAVVAPPNGHHKYLLAHPNPKRSSKNGAFQKFRLVAQLQHS